MPGEEEVEEQMRILRRFAGAYCRQYHSADDGLCEQCADLLRYARDRLTRCPHDPKPMCKDCPTHCYGLPYRKRMREVMLFSVKHFARRGRLDILLRALKAR